MQSHQELQRKALMDKRKERHCVNDCTHTHCGLNERHWWGDKGAELSSHKAQAPVLVCPKRGSVVEVHENDTYHDDPNNAHDDHHLSILPPVLVFQFSGAALELRCSGLQRIRPVVQF